MFSTFCNTEKLSISYLKGVKASKLEERNALFIRIHSMLCDISSCSREAARNGSSTNGQAIKRGRGVKAGDTKKKKLTMAMKLKGVRL